MALIPDWVRGTGGAAGMQRPSWPGVRTPVARPADRVSSIDENAEVIGVCIAGHARAYLVRALMRNPSRHVVNDLLEGQPVSVTFCDRTKCSRVFTGPAGSPLDLGVGGWRNDGMSLLVGDQEYSQETGESLASPGAAPLPYPELPYERTSWRSWKRTHPDTDAYTGEQTHG